MSKFGAEFKIIEEIDEGGMAKIYKVMHQKIDGSEEIKIIKSPKKEIIDKKSNLDRFHREVEMAMRLSSSNIKDNIVKIFSVNKDPDGVSFILMEYLPYNLGKIRKNKKLTEKQALIIISKVAEILYEAHNFSFIYNETKCQGLVHRDIKPENIFIDAHGTIKIGDFGLTKPITSGQSRISKTMTAGTFDYMAPEIFDEKDKCDHRIDIYAAGVTLYNLLTGQLPFEDTTNIKEKIKRIEKGRYTPIRKIDKTFNRALEKIIQKAMAVNIKKRYNEASEMEADINKYIEQKYGNIDFKKEITILIGVKPPQSSNRTEIYQSDNGASSPENFSEKESKNPEITLNADHTGRIISSFNSQSVKKKLFAALIGTIILFLVGIIAMNLGSVLNNKSTIVLYSDVPNLLINFNKSQYTTTQGYKIFNVDNLGEYRIEIINKDNDSERTINIIDMKKKGEVQIISALFKK